MDRFKLSHIRRQEDIKFCSDHLSNMKDYRIELSLWTGIKHKTSWQFLMIADGSKLLPSFRVDNCVRLTKKERKSIYMYTHVSINNL